MDIRRSDTPSICHIYPFGDTYSPAIVTCIGAVDRADRDLVISFVRVSSQFSYVTAVFAFNAFFGLCIYVFFSASNCCPSCRKQ